MPTRKSTRPREKPSFRNEPLRDVGSLLAKYRWTAGLLVVALFSVGLTGFVAGDVWWFSAAWSDTLFVLTVAAMWTTGLAVYPAGHRPPARETLSRRLIGIGLLAGIMVATYDRTRGPAAAGSLAPVAVGIGLFLLAALVGAAALITLGRAKAYSPDPGARAGGSLVVSGIYRYVRHPMYTALLACGAGVPLLARSLLGMATGLGVLVPAVILRVREEEASLLATYGESYRQYASRVRRLIPFVF